jgi:NADPH2:quinone reductase
MEAFTKEAGNGYDVVLDFLWGRPTELFFQTLVPKAAGFATHKTRFVEIGESAGSSISLPAEVIRTSGLEIMGAGNVSPQIVPEALNQIWTWISEGKLIIDIEKVPLKDVAQAWERKTEGQRIVIVP